MITELARDYPDFVVPAKEGGCRDYISAIKHVLSHAKLYLLALSIERRYHFMMCLNMTLKMWHDEAGWAPYEGFTGPYTCQGIEGGKLIYEEGNVNGFTRAVSLNGRVIEKESYWHGEYKFEQL